MKTILWVVSMLIGVAAQAGARPELQIIGDAIVVPLTEQTASAEMGSAFSSHARAGTASCAIKWRGLMRPFKETSVRS